jgi:hypothetical protein
MLNLELGAREPLKTVLNMILPIYRVQITIFSESQSTMLLFVQSAINQFRQ